MADGKKVTLPEKHRHVTELLIFLASARTIHEYLLRRSILRPAGLVSFGLLDGLQVRLCRPYWRETRAGFSLECLATALMNNPG